MARRFYDTGMFDDSWFMNLDKDSKIFFWYFISKCDHAGILDINFTLAEVQTGIKNLESKFKNILNTLNNRIVHVKENYYFSPKFVNYQYPKGLNPENNAHKSVINRLEAFNLIDCNTLILKEVLAPTEPLRSPCQGAQDKGKDKGKDKDKSKSKKKDFVYQSPPTYEEWCNYCKEKGYSGIAKKTFDYYSESNWRDGKGNPLRNWKQKLIAVWFREENREKKNKISDVQRSRLKKLAEGTLYDH